MKYGINRRKFAGLLGGSAITLAWAPRAFADYSIRVCSTSQPGPSGCFVANDTGIFERNGIRFEHVLIGVDPNVPAAVMSGSVEIGVCTVSTVLMAADNGLDIVVIGGAAASNKDKLDYAIVARKGGGIATPADLVGKTIAVPGIGAVFDILLRAWLEQKGLPVQKMKIVEAAFPTHLDQLKSGMFDAVVTSVPFIDNILKSGVGEVLVPLPMELPDRLPLNLYMTTRAWAGSNAAAIAAFRKSLAEGVARAQADEVQLRASIGKYLKLPPAVLANFSLPTLVPDPAPELLGWWEKEMKRQDRISKVTIADILYR
jgi:NitT/TauT family transport system substrate-binding protein